MELNTEFRPTDAALSIAGSQRVGSAFQGIDTLTPERPRLTERAIGGWGHCTQNRAPREFLP